VNPIPRSPSAEDLALLSQVIRDVARARRLCSADAQDFTQSVHVRLIERDYDVFRRFGGRSSLRTYLRVVVTRLMLDWLNGRYGKWRPSAAAQRLGEHAVALDRLIDRDGYSIDEAVASLAARGGEWSTASLRQVAEQLPKRSRRRFVSEEVLNTGPGVPFEDPIATEQNRHVKARIGKALHDAVGQLPVEERRLVILRYGRGCSVQLLAQQMGVDAKPLYRRFERTLRSLRQSLIEAGVTGAASVVSTTCPADRTGGRGWSST
jgi:RNA polymerase sigma factor (sigma-70 family)